MTVPTVDGDYSAWHRGREWAGVWVLDVDHREVRDLLKAARARLGGLIRSRYERQPHVSVGYVGLLRDSRLPGYDAGRLDRDLAWLRAHLPGTLTVTACRWNSFELVPCLDVEVGPWLAEAHRALSGDEVIREYRPHITVGQYAVSVPASDAVARLDGPALGEPIPQSSWRCDRLVLARYAAADLSGPLAREGWVDLASGCWRPARDAVLRGASNS